MILHFKIIKMFNNHQKILDIFSDLWKFEKTTKESIDFDTNTLKKREDDLVFDSNFESGNLFSAHRVC